MKIAILCFGYLFSINTIQAQWVRKNDFPGLGREGAMGFSLNGKGYFGCGQRNDEIKDSQGNWIRDTMTHFTDLWQYDPVIDKWTKKKDFPDVSRTYGISFNLNGKAYVGLGWKGSNKGVTSYARDLYEYDDKTDTWTKKSDFPRYDWWSTSFFSIDGIGYIASGMTTNGSYFNDSLVNETWGYNATKDKWEKKADFPGEWRWWATAFSINGKGYVGLGSGDSVPARSDFYEYDPKKDSWRRLPDFPGAARWSATGFSLSNKGYVVGGTGAGEYNDLWEYDPVAEKWTQLDSFPGQKRYDGPSFVIDNKAYYGLARGLSTYTCFTDFYQFIAKVVDTTHTTGISQIENKSISIFPNPSQSGFTVNYKMLKSNKLSLVIKNVNGQIIYSKEYKNISGDFTEQINLPNAPRGMYILEFVSDWDKINTKIILE